MRQRILKLLEITGDVGTSSIPLIVACGLPIGVAMSLHTRASMKPGKFEDEIQKIVAGKLSEVGLKEDAEKMPADLSGGMRKRVGLARAMTNLADDTEAVKHNFLLRGFFHNRGYYNLSELTPAEYRSSKFVTSKAAKRVWLQESELFAKSAKGAESLSPKGREELDKAMSAFVPNLPNSPIMVEGYSGQGSPDQAFRKSQQRALVVQQYLEARFQLNPKLVGGIPFGGSPPESGGKKDWSGVSLVLLP